MSDTDSYDSPLEFGTDPEKIARRWLLEIALYDKNMRTWKTKASDVWKRYRGEAVAKNSFNILWANTELLRQAVYQSMPAPDVRRRFRDDDKVGAAVGEVIQRALAFCEDEGDFDRYLKAAVLDAVLVGRGVVRLRYVPSFESAPESAEEVKEDSDTLGQLTADSDAETLEGETAEGEELSFERVTLDHVQADDFAHGPGKSWGEVTWVGFRHEMSRDELKERFGKQVAYTCTMQDADITKESLDDNDPVKDLFRHVEVWEIWDKETRRVLFVSEGYRNGPLGVVEDPLGLEQFFPVPRPLYCIEDSASLRPIVLYQQYKEQAEQLDRLNTRMNKIIDAIRVRGVYDGSIAEFSNLMKAEDNSLVPANDAALYMDRGGIQNAIWYMPIEPYAVVLQQLSLEAEHCKQVIYELTGFADIMRGASDPDETATAQNLKSQWGGSRLAKMQGAVQSLVLHVYELTAEIVCKRFQPETLAQMTGLQYPTLAEAKQQVYQQGAQLMQQYQMAAMQAQAQGQPPPPPPPAPEMPLNWGQIVTTMRDDAGRQFKIDVETTVTVGQQQQQDMASLKDLLLTVSQVLQELMPLVQLGVLPLDAVKEIVLAVARRAQLGNTAEDALSKLQQPPPPPPQAPQQAAGNEPLSAQQQMQIKLAEMQQKATLEQQKLQAKVQTDTQSAQAKLQADTQVAALEAEMKAEIEKMRLEMQAQVELIKAKLQQQTAIHTAATTPLSTGVQ